MPESTRDGHWVKMSLYRSCRYNGHALNSYLLTANVRYPKVSRYFL